MDALLQAIYGKFTGSTLSTFVGGRIYLDEVPESKSPVTFPYITYQIITGGYEKTFTEKFTDVLVQVSLFSASASAVQISAMYNYLTALFDECTLTITGKTFYRMHETNLMTTVDDVLVSSSTATTTRVKHWAVDYEILFE